MNDPQINVEAIYLPAKPSNGDPLGQRGNLAIKVSGGIHEVILEGDVHTAFATLRDKVTKRVEVALLAALQAPDTSVSA